MALTTCAVPRPIETDAGTAPVVLSTCPCARYSGPHQVGTVDSRLNELSGLVASRTQPNVFFAHNDSGDSARFFALHPDGAVVQQFDVEGATNVDWEDIALGPCPNGTCLFVADIGDNAKARTEYVVYRVTEPLVGGPSSVASERFVYTYPQGAHFNAEALFVHPVSGLGYVITKESQTVSSVYRLHFDTAQPQVAEFVTALTLPGPSDRPITGADVSPCGSTVALRLYNRVVRLDLIGDGGFESIFAGPVTAIPWVDENQSEAIAFSADGRSLLTTSEQLADQVPIWQGECH